MQRIVWITAALAMLTASTAMAAKIYKWRDSQGHTHYGELPPVGRAAQPLDIQTPPEHTAPSQPTPRPGTPLSSNSQETAAQPSGSDRRVQPNADNRQPSCPAARQNLLYLQAGGSNRRYRDASGKVIRYTQAQREAKIAATKRYLEEYCLPSNP
ncbi:MAG: DUF4124 domain-containing protein [Nitrococcus mobilis]|nr:DUF4124 domain-containing protein [Nitrococcus mobilis]